MFEQSGIQPETTSLVTMENIVDCLWRDRDGRRKVRVSIHALANKPTLTK